MKKIFGVTFLLVVGILLHMVVGFRGTVFAQEVPAEYLLKAGEDASWLKPNSHWPWKSGVDTICGGDGFSWDIWAVIWVNAWSPDCLDGKAAAQIGYKFRLDPLQSQPDLRVRITASFRYDVSVLGADVWLGQEGKADANVRLAAVPSTMNIWEQHLPSKILAYHEPIDGSMKHVVLDTTVGELLTIEAIIWEISGNASCTGVPCLSVVSGGVTVGSLKIDFEPFDRAVTTRCPPPLGTPYTQDINNDGIRDWHIETFGQFDLWCINQNEGNDNHRDPPRDEYFALTFNDRLWCAGCFFDGGDNWPTFDGDKVEWTNFDDGFGGQADPTDDDHDVTLDALHFIFDGGTNTLQIQHYEGKDTNGDGKVDILNKTEMGNPVFDTGAISPFTTPSELHDKAFTILSGSPQPGDPRCSLLPEDVNSEKHRRFIDEVVRKYLVTIDIKPGSFPNSINPRNKGVIPVAILTTDTFDATTVDSTTVLFGATGTEAAPVHAALEDVDGDGDTDMILHFNTQDTGIVCADTSAILTGKILGGQAITGSDSINTVGCK